MMTTSKILIFELYRNTIQNNPVIQNRLLANDLNPCNGERPQYCQLRDGTTVQFNLNVADNGDVPEFCVCPNGKEKNHQF